MLKQPANGFSDQPDNSLVKDSVLYKEFLAEREEILRHKWIESEKAGKDIGFEKALFDWIVKHRASWRANRLRRNRNELVQAFPSLQQLSD